MGTLVSSEHHYHCIRSDVKHNLCLYTNVSWKGECQHAVCYEILRIRSRLHREGSIQLYSAGLLPMFGWLARYMENSSVLSTVLIGTPAVGCVRGHQL